MKKLYNRLVAMFVGTQLGRFLVVGCGAFLVNVILLYTLHGILGLAIFPAQLLGAEGTIVFSFVLHHHWTYRHYNPKPLIVRFIEFNGSAMGGSIVSTLSVLAGTQLLHVHYLLALSVGAILATSWNYFANQYFIWTKLAKKQTEHEQV